MAVTAKLFGLVYQSAFNKEIDWDTDDIKAMLCTSAYVPNQDTHRYKSSVTNEVTGTGYTAGGIAVPTRSFSYNAGTNALTLAGGNLAFGTLTVTGIRQVIFYNNTPATDATRPLIAYMDLGADQSPSGVAFNIDMTAGYAVLTAA